MKLMYALLLMFTGNSISAQEPITLAEQSDDYSEESESSFTSEQYSQWESLNDAIRENDISLIRQLIAQGAPLNAPNGELIEETHIACAAIHGDKAVIDILLDAGADIEAENNQDDTALTVAASHGRTAMVRYLIDHGAYLQRNGYYNCGPLYKAAFAGHNECIQVLIDAGAELDQETSMELRAASRNGHLETIKLLLQLGANLYGTYDNGNTCLHEAAIHNHVDCVDYLIKRGIKIDAPNQKSKTPLFLACTNCSPQTAQHNYGTASFLLEHNANPNVVVSDGSTILHQNGIQAAIVGLLLTFGADADKKNRLSITPFQESVLYPEKREDNLDAFMKYSYKSLIATKEQHIKRCATLRELFLVFVRLNLPLYVQMNILDFDEEWTREVTEVAFYKTVQNGALRSPLLIHAKDKIIELWWKKLNDKIRVTQWPDILSKIKIPQYMYEDFYDQIPSSELVDNWDTKKDYYRDLISRTGQLCMMLPSSVNEKTHEKENNVV